MAITNEAFQQVVLERLINIESMVTTAVQLQGLEGGSNAAHLQLILKFLRAMAQEQLGGALPDIPESNLIHRYQEVFDENYEKAAIQVADRLRELSDDDFDRVDTLSEVIH